MDTIIDQMRAHFRKSSFYVAGGGGAVDVYGLACLVAKKVGIADSGQFYNRVVTGMRLTEEDYGKLQRCPAAYKPTSVSLRELQELKRFLHEPLLQQQARAHAAAVANNWVVQLDSVAHIEAFVKRLSMDAKILHGYTRMRIGKVIYVLKARNLWTSDCDTLCSLAAANSWRWSRLTNALHAVVYGSESQVREYFEFLTTGGAGATDEEYVKAAKMHQVLLRGSRMNIFGEYVDVDAIDKLSYIATLIGRCVLNNTEAFEKEKLARTRPVPDYVCAWNKGLDMTSEMNQTWVRRIKAFGMDTNLISWDDWQSYRYINTPTGSSTLSRDKVLELIVDIDKRQLLSSRAGTALMLDELAELVGGTGSARVKLRGSKRILGELIDSYNLDDIEIKMLVFAFLKWEPAAQRYLYPTDYVATDLSAFMTHSGFDAMCKCSGTDLGHDLVGGLAVKLDVMGMVRSSACSANVDGKGFNEGHSARVQEQIRRIQIDACRAGTATGLIEEHEKAQSIYSAMKRASVIVVMHPRTRRVERIAVGAKTLYSGEDCTQTVNTGVMGAIGPLCADYLTDNGLLSLVALFFKGDDLNGYFRHWLEAVLFILTVEDCGIELGKIKDFLEYDASEHERCIVTKSGYNGSLFRKIGFLTPSEPQGIGQLTLEETMQFALDASDELIARGAPKIAADVTMHEVLATYFDCYGHVNEFIPAFGVLKISGGVGAFLPSGYDVVMTASGKRPHIVTRFKLHDSGVFARRGSARLTDALLMSLELRFGLTPGKLDAHRASLLGAGLETGLGAAKYGARGVPEALDLAVLSAGDASRHDADYAAASSAVSPVVDKEARQERRQRRGHGGLEEGECSDDDWLSDEGEVVDGVARAKRIEELSAVRITPVAEKAWAEVAVEGVAKSRLDGHNLELMRHLQIEPGHERKVRIHRCVLDKETECFAYELASELKRHLADGTAMRGLDLTAPQDLLLRVISRQGYINIDIAATILDLPIKSPTERLNLRDVLASRVRDDAEARIYSAVRSMKEPSLQIAYYDGAVECVFWPWASGLSSDAKALVARLVLSRLPRKSGQCGFAKVRSISPVLHESIVASLIGRIVYEQNKEVLHSVSY